MQKLKTFLIYFFRTLAVVPLFLVLLVSALYKAVTFAIYFMRYGGEFVKHAKEDTPATISKTYEQLLINQEKMEATKELYDVVDDITKANDHLFKEDLQKAMEGVKKAFNIIALAGIIAITLSSCATSRGQCTGANTAIGCGGTTKQVLDHYRKAHH